MQVWGIAQPVSKELLSYKGSFNQAQHHLGVLRFGPLLLWYQVSPIFGAKRNLTQITVKSTNKLMIK